MTTTIRYVFFNITLDLLFFSNNSWRVALPLLGRQRALNEQFTKVMGMMRCIVVFLVMLFGFVMPSLADDVIVVQSTTSTRNSGLYDYLLPLVKAETGITVKVVAVGTGAALKNARNCDGDVLLVHSRSREDQFVADGFADRRYDLMYNDYVLVGPGGDPAELGGASDIANAMKRLTRGTAKFVSRGDDSGTHGKEKLLWKAAGIEAEQRDSSWYREAGAGMGETLNMAVGLGAYTLSDRASWQAYANKSGFKIHRQGDKILFNPYGIMLISAKKCPAVNRAAGQAFIDWMLAPRGQQAIAAYRVGGKPLFFPNAN